MKATKEKPAIQARQSKYCDAILIELQHKGHASNAQLLDSLRSTYPGLSATTVHRATARLEERGEIALGPADKQGAMRYDANTTPHDHFVCSKCDTMRDADIAQEVSAILKDKIVGCGVAGNLTIHGICKECQKKERV